MNALNDELARWGEPPADPAEQALADRLAGALDERRRPGAPAAPELEAGDLARDLLEASDWLDQFVTCVLELSGLGAGGPIPTLETTPEEAHPAPTDPLPGEYRFRAVLAEGPACAVWLADDLHRGVPVAVKVVRPAATPAQLRDEARLLAGLRHPNLVAVVGWHTGPAGEHFLVEQYVAGGSFEGRLARGERLDWARAARHAADVGEALALLHAHGLAHRDVRPANLLWDPAGDEAVLTAFGLTSRLGPCPGAPAGDVRGLASALLALVGGGRLPTRLEEVVRPALTPGGPTVAEFTAGLRGALNQLLADRLVPPEAGPVELCLRVSREAGGRLVPVASTRPHPRAAGRGEALRDLRRVPPEPERVELRSGDRVRLEVCADHDGFVSVFNVGPQGNLHLLDPEDDPGPPVRAGRPLHLLEVELTPPAGRERLCAVWSRRPLPPAGLAEEAAVGRGGVSAAYRATRRLERLGEALSQLPPGEWQAVVLELEHRE
jgi:hypothetical protein